MEWHVDGHVLIACNCDYGCPCNFNARPTHGECEGGWIWAIESGKVDGVAVDGLAVAVFADWPGAIHEGGGKATAYIDERADATQRATLTRLVRGEIGGPWQLFSGTYALSGPTPARIDITVAGNDSRVTIDDAVALEMQSIRNPVTGVEVHPGVVLPEGLVVKQADLATSALFRVRGDVAYDHSGKYAATGRFRYGS
jgi:hypothetical protein